MDPGATGGAAHAPPPMGHQPPPPHHQPQMGGAQSDGIISDLRLSVIDVLQDYGWFIVLGCAITYIVYNKITANLNTPSLSRGSSGGGSNRSTTPEDADKILERQERIAAARAKMQAELDKKVELEKEKLREKGEQDRENKIQQWENLQSGKGYYSKMKSPATDADSTNDEKLEAELRSKVAAKTLANPKRDYNPLMGGSSAGSSGDSCSWRPGMRRMGGGGG